MWWLLCQLMDGWLLLQKREFVAVTCLAPRPLWVNNKNVKAFLGGLRWPDDATRCGWSELLYPVLQQKCTWVLKTSEQECCRKARLEGLRFVCRSGGGCGAGLDNLFIFCSLCEIDLWKTLFYTWENVSTGSLEVRLILTSNPPGPLVELASP